MLSSWLKRQSWDGTFADCLTFELPWVGCPLIFFFLPHLFLWEAIACWICYVTNDSASNHVVLPISHIEKASYELLKTCALARGKAWRFPPLVHFRGWCGESHPTLGTGGRGSESLALHFPRDAAGVWVQLAKALHFWGWVWASGVCLTQMGFLQGFMCSVPKA